MIVSIATLLLMQKGLFGNIFDNFSDLLNGPKVIKEVFPSSEGSEIDSFIQSPEEKSSTSEPSSGVPNAPEDPNNSPNKYPKSNIALIAFVVVAGTFAIFYVGHVVLINGAIAAIIADS